MIFFARSGVVRRRGIGRRACRVVGRPVRRFPIAPRGVADELAKEIQLAAGAATLTSSLWLAASRSAVERAVESSTLARFSCVAARTARVTAHASLCRVRARGLRRPRRLRRSRQVRCARPRCPLRVRVLALRWACRPLRQHGRLAADRPRRRRAGVGSATREALARSRCLVSRFTFAVEAMDASPACPWLWSML